VVVEDALGEVFGAHSLESLADGSVEAGSVGGDGCVRGKEVGSIAPQSAVDVKAVCVLQVPHLILVVESGNTSSDFLCRRFCCWWPPGRRRQDDRDAYRVGCVMIRDDRQRAPPRSGISPALGVIAIELWVVMQQGDLPPPSDIGVLVLKDTPRNARAAGAVPLQPQHQPPRFGSKTVRGKSGDGLVCKPGAQGPSPKTVHLAVVLAKPRLDRCMSAGHKAIAGDVADTNNTIVGEQRCHVTPATKLGEMTKRASDIFDFADRFDALDITGKPGKRRRVLAVDKAGNAQPGQRDCCEPHVSTPSAVIEEWLGGSERAELDAMGVEGVLFAYFPAKWL